MLKHHRHACRARRTGLVRGIGRLKKPHFPGIGPHQPVDHLHQSRFSSAILAQERVNFALADVKRHILIGNDAGVGFCQPLKL